MGKVFFGFAVADSMFNVGKFDKTVLSFDDAKALIGDGVEVCLNPSHLATIKVMESKGIKVDIPETPPRVSLSIGDKVIVMSVRGLPRLTDRHEYNDEEIASASFSFSLWTVLDPSNYPTYNIWNVWIGKDEFGKEYQTEVNPDYYEEYGTPIDICGNDMRYSHSFIV
jgi:hypothetical protein